jgi:hypothetical protein
MQRLDVVAYQSNKASFIENKEGNSVSSVDFTNKAVH